MRFLLVMLFLSLPIFFVQGQDVTSYLRKNAIRIDDAEKLNDSVYNLLSPYQVFMVGEMHGTNEPAQFVRALMDLLVSKGDSVQLGFEIPQMRMAKYLASHTDSSIYLSDFFYIASTASGRESIAWAKTIARFKNNPKVQLFFYDVNEGAYKSSEERDSLLYVNIKKQFNEHPTWKMVTLSGNVHNMTKPENQLGRNTMASWLKHDWELNLSDKICSINHYYSIGTALYNTGDGLKEHRIGNPESERSTALNFDSYIVLARETSPSPYNAIYYTKNVTAAKMVKGNFDLPSLKSELSAIYDRDQKTRTGADSARFAGYIDSTNQVRVKELIQIYGWPGRSFVGPRGNVAAYAVIQHSDSATQEKYFPMLQRSVADSESRIDDMVLMQDRLLMRRGEKQVYGSQIILNKKTGAWEFWPIEDEKNVNLRRAKVGFDPIEEYAKHFGIEYKSH